jgi:streptogramin lyase
MDPRDFHVTARVNLPGLRGPIRLAEVGGEAIWIADTGTGTIYKIDPDSESVALTFRAMMNARDSHLGFGHGSLWVVTDGGRGDNVLTRFNAETGAVEAAIALPTHSMGGAHYAFDSVWVVGTRRNELYRIDPATNAIVSTTALERDPAYVISAEGSVWVNSRSGFVQRIDPVTGEVIARIETTYQGVDQLTAGGGFIWLGTSFAAVTQIDPATNTIRRAWIGDQLQSTPDLLYAFGALWTYESPKAFLRITPPE